ncbi:MAG: hypothetical protein JSW61_14155 [Candidatus Thorarchaeota archaeon]|nr:MAG: hypothetical protein JSW61_14155 [Candidatus Thorarchaeota archaeon]
MSRQEDISKTEAELQFHVRHVRWFVNFIAEPSLAGEELDAICSNLAGNIESALVEDSAIDKLAIEVEVSWGQVAEMNLEEMTWLGILKIQTDLGHARIDVKDIQNVSIRLTKVLMENFGDLNQQGRIMFDTESPLYVVLSSDKTSPEVDAWDTQTIQRYKKELGPYLALYSGQWPDYSDELYNRRIEKNLSNRTTELHFYARNSAFIYIEGEGYEKYWNYVEDVMDPPLVRARGVIFVMLKLQELIQRFHQELPDLKMQDISIIEEKQAELEKTNRSLMQLIAAIRRENMVNMRAHARALNDHLVDIFRIEEVLSHVTSELNYVHESVQSVHEEKNREIQKRQERLFLYLSIILGASVVTEAINILIAPYVDTPEYLIIRYSMALSIVAIFLFIMIRIFKK